MLDLAAVLALAQACAPSVAPHTLAAVAQVESRFDPLAIGVNRGPRPAARPRDPAQAARLARDLLARDADLDLGLAQINSGNLDWLGLTLEDVFDPCRNLAAAATVLRAGYRPAANTASARQAALRIALSRYNTGDARRGFRNGYVARVEAAARRLAPGAPTLAAARAPITRPPEPAAPPPAWDVFARTDAPPVLIFTSPAPRRSPSP